jgi:hypothetical protein
MAKFIPEWHRASGPQLRVKRMLDALDDDHVVRQPLRPDACAADIFIQHRGKGWLAIAVSIVPFSDVDPAQLAVPCAPDPRGQLERRLAQLHALRSRPASSRMAILVIMWKCSTEQTEILRREYHERYRARLVSREQFSDRCVEIIDDLLNPLSEEDEQDVLGTYFPEAEIPSIFTARSRRLFHRDNSAQLGRSFLDPEQEWAVKLDLDMHEEQRVAASDFSVRLVNGVAGSGKTLITVHRALLLAELFPRESTLVLIHNAPIVADLKARLHRAHGPLPENLEIQTFMAWCRAQWHTVFHQVPRMPDPRMVLDTVRHQRKRWPELRASDDQLVAELDFINDALIRDEPAYLAAGRGGRGFGLRAAERRQVWSLSRAVEEGLRRAGLLSWSALPRDICMAADRAEDLALRRYRSILVDEAQFFAPSWFRLVKLSLRANGQLFLCADPTQGFLKNRLSWRSAGLDVSGRTKKLHRSYRMTRPILEAATAILEELGQGDREDCLEPDMAGMVAGTRPVLLRADTPQDGVDRLVNELVSAHQAGVPLGAFLVIYGENAGRRILYEKLCGRFGKGNVWWFNEGSQKKAPPQGPDREYLRMANLDTATGLEGHVVFLVGVERLFDSARSASVVGDEQAERREENARKLYMAMTRAGEKLVVVSSQPLPPGIEAWFELAVRAPERGAT